MTDAEGFLSRWSRRKRGVAAAEPEPAPVEAPPGVDPPVVEAFDPATLPPLDSLTAASDFRDFLRPEVPAALREAALRQAWTLDPLIRDYIGPADYAWDWNAPDGVPGFAPRLAGDMGRLLAQAIGAPPPAPDPSEPVVVAEAPIIVPEPAPEPEAPAASVRLEAPPEPLAEAPAEPVATAARRRHGGAVPV